MEEQSIWKGTPSQVTNLSTFIVCGLTCFLIVPVFIACWRWLVTRCTVYEITTERILFTRGVLSKHTDTLELYRVKDIRVEQPFFLRLFGLCNVVLHTSDHTTPIFVLPAVETKAGLQDVLRKHVELRRDVKRVREVDFE